MNDQQKEQLKQRLALKIVEWRNGKGPLLENLLDEVISEIASFSCGSAASGSYIVNGVLSHNGKNYSRVPTSEFNNLDFNKIYILYDSLQKKTSEVMVDSFDLTLDLISFSTDLNDPSDPFGLNFFDIPVSDFTMGAYQLFEDIT